MKSIEWIGPLVATSVLLVISGCSQMQQTVAPANAANRLSTGNAVGSGLSRSGANNRLGVTTSGGILGRGNSSRLGTSALGRGTSSRFGGRSTASGIGGSSTSGIGGSSGLGGRTTSSFGGRAVTGAYGSGRGGASGTGSSGLGGSGIGGSGSLSSRGFGSTGSGSAGGFGSGSFDNRIGANGADNRLGGSGTVPRTGSGLGGRSRIGGAGGGDYKVTDLNDSSSVLSRRVIYFAYDQSTIEPEYFEILDAHSELLASNPNLTIRLEGHADERGSREYNIALSERRAQAVKQFMDLKGVGSEQSQTVAYGEELPVDPGHNEAAWSKNRRVEIKYIGR